MAHSGQEKGEGRGVGGRREGLWRAGERKGKGSRGRERGPMEDRRGEREGE